MDSNAPPRLTLLVVDDERVNLTSFARAFRKNVDVLTATSGPEAFDVAASRHVDAVLVDYMMPAMAGLEVLRSFRLRWPRTARALLTAHADLDELRGVIASDLAEAVFGKPCDREDILG